MNVNVKFQSVDYHPAPGEVWVIEHRLFRNRLSVIEITEVTEHTVVGKHLTGDGWKEPKRRRRGALIYRVPESTDAAELHQRLTERAGKLNADVDAAAVDYAADVLRLAKGSAL